MCPRIRHRQTILHPINILAQKLQSLNIKIIPYIRLNAKDITVNAKHTHTHTQNLIEAEKKNDFENYACSCLNNWISTS